MVELTNTLVQVNKQLEALLYALRDTRVELDNAIARLTGDHDCTLDEWGSGHCDHPSHHFDLVDQERPQTESEAYRLAH